MAARGAFAVIGSAAVMYAGYKLYQYFTYVDPVVKLRRELVEIVNESHDLEGGGDTPSVVVGSKKLKRRMRYHCLKAVIKAVQHAEVKLGLLKNNSANQMVVSRVVRTYMSASAKDGGLGMRDCDVVRDYHVACCMYFLPRHVGMVCEKILMVDDDDYRKALVYLGLDGSK
jgi:hypothetical protein